MRQTPFHAAVPDTVPTGAGMSDVFAAPFFSRADLGAKLASAAYVSALPVSHALWPEGVWTLALVFLWLMLLPYPWAALRFGVHQRLEFSVAIGLGVLGLLGLFTTPWLLILAIALHGVWDLAKHLGAGVRFFPWYLTGCAIVDVTYAGALSLVVLGVLG